MKDTELTARLAAVVARRWAADGYDAEVDANALVLELTAVVREIADQRAAEELEAARGRFARLVKEHGIAETPNGELFADRVDDVLRRRGEAGR